MSVKSHGRVRNTTRSLHEALIGLILEKDYDHIPVREILDRARVSRTTFYTQFENKDALLASGTERILARSSGAAQSMTSFSLPMFEHHDQHRRTGKMSRKTRTLLHERLRALIARRIRGNARHAAAQDHASSGLPSDLLARHIASTFVVVLDWWLDTQSALTPTQVNDLFCSLVTPALTKTS